jgi:hypothetical protein
LLNPERSNEYSGTHYCALKKVMIFSLLITFPQ